MKKISAIEDIEKACENLNKLGEQVDGFDDARLATAKVLLSIALDKLRELEIKIRNL